MFYLEMPKNRFRVENIFYKENFLPSRNSSSVSKWKKRSPFRITFRLLMAASWRRRGKLGTFDGLKLGIRRIDQFSLFRKILTRHFRVNVWFFKDFSGLNITFSRKIKTCQGENKKVYVSIFSSSVDPWKREVWLWHRRTPPDPSAVYFPHIEVSRYAENA